MEPSLWRDVRGSSGRHTASLRTAIAAGLLGSVVVGGIDRLLDPLISTQQKWRDRLVRPAPPHQLAAILVGRRLKGGKLHRRGKQTAQTAFGLAYGLGWGLAYHALRRRAPQIARWMGLPFGIGFFLACDGLIAPLLGLSPPLRWIPWQPNAKELANHVAWTLTAELVHRGAGA